MDDDVRAYLIDHASHTCRISNIELDQLEPRVPRRGGQVCALAGCRVERVEVVDHHDLATVGEETIDEVRTDEPRAAGHDRPHTRLRPSLVTVGSLLLHDQL